MRRTIAIVLAAMLASSMAFAQSNTHSGAGVAGKPGSKSGPAATKSGPGASNQAVLVLNAGGVAEGAADQAPPSVAFFGFQLINTSLQSTTAEEKARIRMLDDAFRKKLDASGRFKIVPIPPDVLQEIAAAPEISSCNGCERDFAIKAGADWAAWGTVQKVSNLILNINVYIEDARQKKMEFVKSVDIRGNTDESWQRGLDYMLRHYLLRDSDDNAP